MSYYSLQNQPFWHKKVVGIQFDNYLVKVIK